MSPEACEDRVFCGTIHSSQVVKLVFRPVNGQAVKETRHEDAAKKNTIISFVD